MLNRPKPESTLPQKLYDIAAKTRIELDADRLAPTLLDAQNETGDAPCVILHVLIDVVSPESLKNSARQLREIADLVEAAADKPH